MRWPSAVLSGVMCGVGACGAGSQAPTDAAWKVTGSYYNLYTRSRTTLPPTQRFVLDFNRLRLELEGKPVTSIAVHVQYDNELLLGNYLKTTQFALTDDRGETSFDWQRAYAVRPELIARHGLYRATLTWSGKTTDVTVGRQRIALGTGFFWSPMDLLNPIDPTRLDRNYRVGADAVLVDEKLGALGRISGMYAPSTTRMKSVGAAYLHGNLRGSDFSLLAGRFRGVDALGANVSSSVGGLGVRGELTLTRPDSGVRYGRVVVAADYGFANSVNVTAELYYNGRGRSDPSRYDISELLAGRELNLARWYAGAATTYQVGPLVKVAGYVVVNTDDGSVVLWPRVEWSARTNLDLTAGIQRFAGGKRSEYGRLNTLVHLEVKAFF